MNVIILPLFVQFFLVSLSLRALLRERALILSPSFLPRKIHSESHFLLNHSVDKLSKLIDITRNNYRIYISQKVYNPPDVHIMSELETENMFIVK